MGTVAHMKPAAVATIGASVDADMLAEKIAAGRTAYEAAERRRHEAATALAAAERGVAEAQAAYEATKQAAATGDDVTADDLGLALHRIAGAQSLADIRRATVAACEAAMDKELWPVVHALRSAASRRAVRLGERIEARRAEIDALHRELSADLHLQRSAENLACSIEIRRTAMCNVSALEAVQGTLDLSQLATPA